MTRRWLRAVTGVTLAMAVVVLAQGCIVSTEPPTEDDLGEVEQAASTPPMSRAQILGIAASVEGYSYWWGHGAWDPSGPAYPGKCSGSCGKSCSHSATAGGPEYGADCSGFVAQAWQVPTESDVSQDHHPYTTADFRYSEIHWKRIKRSELQPGDALVYRSGTHGHIVIFERWTAGGQAVVYECAGCSSLCGHHPRTIGKAYVAIRRNGLQDSTCKELVDQFDWKSKGCDNNGSTAECGGKGMKTSDCSTCCGSTCVDDAECGSGRMCTPSGRGKTYCCQAKGKTGQKCVDTSQCPKGQVCMWSNGKGSSFVCAVPQCLDSPGASGNDETGTGTSTGGGTSPGSAGGKCSYSPAGGHSGQLNWLFALAAALLFISRRRPSR
ncbi:MAG: C40 family peptidase [Myxococcales bacterium]|nr:C40 family peptidase [Myxococcales bacterium]